MKTLQAGEHVVGRDGRRLGHVESLVVDEQAHRITHLVIGGRVVPTSLFTAAGPTSLQLDLDEAGLKAQPDVEHARLAGAPAHWEAPNGWARSNFLRIAEAFIGQGPYIPPVTLGDDAENVHEITEGSPVWSGGDELGRVASVDTDDGGAITRIVVDAHRRRIAVPIAEVEEVVGNNVHLRLSPAEFIALSDAEPAPEA
ncbi:MAG: PRC-barrel domain-containing protein [Candidatus Dormiibacterota bacterium]